MTAIGTIQIYGERCSGTSYLEELINRNVISANVTNEYGWKHTFFNQKVASATDCLFICVYRRAEDWLRSLHRQPFHAAPCLHGLTFSEFIRKEWWCVWDEHAGKTPDDELYGTEMMFERCPLSGRRFSNIIQMRNAKLKNCQRLKFVATNTFYIRYEDLRNNAESVFTDLENQFGIERRNEFTEVTRYRGGRKAYKPKRYKQLSREDTQYINSELNQHQERAIGYTPVPQEVTTMSQPLHRVRRLAEATVNRVVRTASGLRERVRIAPAGSRISFLCNICGVRNELPENNFGREAGCCSRCSSTVRMRAIIHVLTTELFGQSLSLSELPVRKDICGIGLSDWDGYASGLAEKLDYTNTYYHQAPQLDICSIPDCDVGKYDFIISTDVFEHVAPPVGIAFENVCRLLKPSGVFIFSVPWRKEGDTQEHFPDLHNYQLIKRNGESMLINTTSSGEQQEFRDLVFHGGAGATLEMRVFSEEGLRRDFMKAGFDKPQVYVDSCEKFGVVWDCDWSLPMAARPAEAYVSSAADPGKSVVSTDSSTEGDDASPVSSTGLFILGMHRSGTSAFTRVFNLLGANAAGDTTANGEDNPTGFWEPAEVVEIHDSILRHMELTWHSVQSIPDGWECDPAIDQQRGQLRDFCSSQLQAPLWVLKDPRFCRLFPLWRALLNQARVRACCVIPLRHPLDVAASLKARNGFVEGRSALLWLRYVLDAEYHSRGVTRACVRYDRLLDDWRSVTSEIGSVLNIDWPQVPGDEIDEFLDVKRRHHATVDDTTLEGIPATIQPLVARTYTTLLSLANGNRTEIAPVLDEVRRELDCLCECFSSDWLVDERPKNNVLEDTLRSLPRAG